MGPGGQRSVTPFGRDPLVCGIAGCLDGRATAEQLDRLAAAMGATLAHRGPDGQGAWTDPQHGVALAHRRLSVIDLSTAAAQPMVSASGRYVLSYNGEIYNFEILRKELSSYPFKGHSDTEVLLAAIDAWGLTHALRRIRGMFAFAVWDREEARLALARDHAGKKPLYWGWSGTALLFGSELNALRAHPAFDDRLDLDALGDLLRLETIPQPRSIYAAVRKLPPGHWIAFAPGEQPWQATPRSFWQARDIAERVDRDPFTGTYEAALEELDRRIGAAVDARLVADVELGALLSGGIDSSVVVAMMQRHGDRPVRTFTIGFEVPRFNEAEHAAAVAKHLGTEHHELYVTPQQALGVIDELPHVYDEPFAYASQIPTLLVCRLARRDVTVALAGDGGDELFAGYNRYLKVMARWRRIGRLPMPIRRLLAHTERALRNRCWDLAAPEDTSVPMAAWRRPFAAPGKRWGQWLAADVRALMEQRLTDSWTYDEWVPEAEPTASPFSDAASWADVRSPLLALRHYDYVGFLPEAVLSKVDRASMAVSLEVRAPLLDVDLLEFAWSLPDGFVVDASGGKRILKDLLARYVPRELFERPKRGFSVPTAEWLRGPLRAWAEELLDPRTLAEQGLLDVERVRRTWAQHQCGWANHSEPLWSMLMFQSWLKAHRPTQSPAANTNSALPGS
jgi:asparagine synthase (glutamine-hydrolysing)